MSDADARQSVEHLRDLLTRAANRGGGWPYYAEKSSRVEPTAWTLLALNGAWSSTAADWERFAAPHLAWLASRQRANGLLVDAAEDIPNFTSNGTAACALASFGRSGDAVLDRLVGGLIAVKGVSVDNPDPRQDNRLQGWPWIADTFSWLEPTAWCALALKKKRAAPGAEARIVEADKLIVNRSCDAGGWNYGNAATLGQDLRPYGPTTALGLLALQDRRGEPAVTRSLAFLTGASVREPSAMAMSLAAIALRVYGAATGQVDERLAADVDRAERLGNLQALAMMLYALSARTHNVQALRV